MDKKQVILIRGGESFATDNDYYEFLRSLKVNPYKNPQKWALSLSERLGESCDVIVPTMPAKENAKYEAWKIWFEKHFSYFKDDLVLIGYSLGGTFLLKYLSENELPKKISQVHFVAPWTGSKLSPLEDVATFGFNIERISVITDKAKEVHVWQSKDDKVVPFSDGESVHTKIPDSQFHIFEDRSHFIQAEFPELVEEIQKA